MKLKIKSLGLVGLILLLLGSQVFLPVSKVYAENTTPDQRYELEYKHWMGARLIAYCFDNDFSGGSSELTMDLDGYGGNNGNMWGASDTVPASGVFANLMPGLGVDSNEIDCSSTSTKDQLAQSVGFRSEGSKSALVKFEEYLFPPELPDGSPRRVSGNSDRVPIADGFKKIIDKRGASTANNKNSVFEYILDSAGKGPDGKYELSKGAQYWYWKSVIANDCKGQFTDDFKNDYSKVSNGKHEPDNATEKTAASYHGVKDGKAYDFKYVVFGVSNDGDNLETLDSDITSGETGLPAIGFTRGQVGNPPDCVDVANRFKGNDMKAGVAEYLTLYEQLVIDCIAAGSTEAECRKTGVTTPSNSPAPDGGAGSEQKIEFQCSVSFNPISWIMCPLIQGFTEAINQLDKQINSMLKIDTKGYFGDATPSGKAFKGVWTNMRTLAVSFLVVIGLIMVIGTAIGTGFFDAYTVKKVFPRLVVAVVLITVSWPLVIFIIDASNYLGLGVRSLIQAPFASQFSNAVKLDGTQLSLGSLGMVGLGLAIGPVGLLTLVAGAFMAVMVAFLTLILRQILVILLAVLAPAAIAAYILPNTQKMGKIWWDFFSKALLAFPIISGFIAAGRVFAVVSQQGPEGNAGTVRGFIGFIAYFAPYFVLPKAFAMAGGALGNLSGMVNDRSKGAFDRLKKVRQNKVKDNLSRATTGNYFRGGTEKNFRGRLNTGIEGATKINKMGADPRRWQAKMKNALADDTEGHLEDAMKHSNMGIWGGDDEKLWAAKENTVEEIAAKLLERDPGRFSDETVRMRAAEQIMADKRAMGAEAFARNRIRLQAKTGTGYIDKKTGKFDAALMMQDINDAYGDDRNGAGKALAEMRTSLANSGQVAGLAGYGTWASQMESMHTARGTAGYDDVKTKAHKAVMADTIMSVNPGNALYGKPSSAAAIGEAHRDRIEAIADALAVGGEIEEFDANTGRVKVDANGNTVKRKATQDDLATAVANAAGIYDAMAQASPNNANAMAEELFGATLKAPKMVQKTHKVVTGTRQIKDKVTGAVIRTEPISEIRGMVDANGKPIMEQAKDKFGDPILEPGLNIRQYITSQMDGNEAFVNRRRDFSAATWAQGQQAQMAAAAGQAGMQTGIGTQPGRQ